MSTGLVLVLVLVFDRSVNNNTSKYKLVVVLVHV